MNERAQAVPRISCVMPAFNEAATLPRVVPQVLAALAQLSPHVELIVVNDGSRDATAAVATALCAVHPQLVLIDLSRNFGKEAALSAGLDGARGDVVFLMDADGQHPTTLLSEMLAGWRQGYDVVYTVRRTRFMKGLYAWVGFRSLALDYEPLPRLAGETRFGFVGALALGTTGLFAFSATPLRLMGMTGVLLSLAALLYGLWVVFEYAFLGISVPGYATIVAGMMLLAGVQLMAIGLLSDPNMWRASTTK